jgi:hypothetical protein
MDRIEINNESFEITGIGSVGDDESSTIYYRLDRYQGDLDAYASALKLDLDQPLDAATASEAVDRRRFNEAIAKDFTYDSGIGQRFGNFHNALYDTITDSFIIVASSALDV